MTALHELSATEILDGYAAKTFSPVEVMQAVLDRVEAQNPAINALIFVEPKAALAEAKQSEERWLKGEPMGLIDGVPVSMKDSIAVAGRPMLRGLKANLGAPPNTYDAPPTSRVREQGGIIFAKTTMPDFGLAGAGVSSAFGITRNPWNLAYNTGGSSAGAGASVAAQCGPLSVGSDIGGSVRLPAAMNGLAGIKPTQGRIPHLPPSSTRSAGPLTRTVKDNALLLTVLSGYDARDYGALAPDTTQFHNELAFDVKGVRIGLLLEGDKGLHPTPIVQACIERAAKAFEAAGAIVEPIPSVVGADFMETVSVLFQIRGFTEFQKIPKSQAGTVPEHFASWFNKINALTAVDVGNAMDKLEAIKAKVIAQLAKFDFIISPVTHASGFPAELLMPADRESQNAYTPIWNQTGNPAMSVCCGFDTALNLPIGLQIVGQRFDDLGVLRMGAAYEAMRGFSMPWPA